MSDSPHATIFALSSGRPPAAIAVVRISGPRAGDALKALGVKTPEPRKAGLARVRDPETGEMIDEALVLWFPGPHSETGEDVAELQPHGGRAVIAATLAALAKIEGLRPAEGGEFTRRGFENGKLDLTAVEGLADLVMAETEGQRRQAFRQMKGALGNRAEAWRTALVETLALVEARIDFSDEADVPEDLLGPAIARVRELEAEIAAALADGRRGERLREGLTVAIAGPPNAGKSTLLNRLARREAAIVSPYAGTTRDVIEVHLDLGGLPVTLLDTAGIRETGDPVEMEGVRRARARAAEADLVLWVTDAREAGPTAEALAAGAGAMAENRPDGRSKADKVSAGWQEVGAGAASRSGAGPQAESAGRGGSSGQRAQGVRPQAGPKADKMTVPVNSAVESLSGAAPSKCAGRPEGLPDGASMAGTSEPASGASWRSGEDTSPASSRPVVWIVRNKIDLIDQSLKNKRTEIHSNDRNERELQVNRALSSTVYAGLTGRNEPDAPVYEYEFNLSAETGAGLDSLVGQLSSAAEAHLAGAESALVTRLRHRQTLEEALAALRRALAEPAASSEDLLAEELRLAARALGRLTGRVDVEDILDVIFRDFCIGK